MRKQIPNIITLLNLFSGCVAIVMAFNGNYTATAIWILMAAIFDFFDGFAARLLHVTSDMGKELDSLADIVSFGVAPAVGIFIMLQQHIDTPTYLVSIKEYIPYMAFIIPVFASFRLAKFNIDTRQTKFFLGLPTPANAFFWISYVYTIRSHNNIGIIETIIFYLTIALIIFFAILMISEIPMFSLKIGSLKFKDNAKQIILVISMLILIAILGIQGIAWGIILYVALSIFYPIKKEEMNNG